MAQLQLVSSPPHPLIDHSEASQTVGHSPRWQTLLTNGLGSTPLYLWDEALQDGVAISVFNYAWFRIGFVGFPFGNTAKGAPLTDSWCQKLRSVKSDVPIHAFRFVGSPFLENFTIPEGSAPTWETAVLNLPHWSLTNLSSSVRRNVRKAEKSGVIIQLATTAQHIQRICSFYQQTISRHDGNLRYSENYFAELVQLAHENKAVRCFIATIQEKVVGFLIAARHGNTVFYLHGGIDFTHQNSRPSDLLFATAIEWAQSIGAEQYNLMASPISQPSLVHFKEKWGGTTQLQHTFNISRPTVGGHLFEAAFSLYEWKQKWKQRSHE